MVKQFTTDIFARLDSSSCINCRLRFLGPYVKSTTTATKLHAEATLIEKKRYRRSMMPVVQAGGIEVDKGDGFKSLELNLTNSDAMSVTVTTRSSLIQFHNNPNVNIIPDFISQPMRVGEKLSFEIRGKLPSTIDQLLEISLFPINAETEYRQTINMLTGSPVATPPRREVTKRVGIFRRKIKDWSIY